MDTIIHCTSQSGSIYEIYYFCILAHIYWAFIALQIPRGRECASTECGHVAATFSRDDAANLHLWFIEFNSDDKFHRIHIRNCRPLYRGIIRSLFGTAPNSKYLKYPILNTPITALTIIYANGHRANVVRTRQLGEHPAANLLLFTPSWSLEMLCSNRE